MSCLPCLFLAGAPLAGLLEHQQFDEMWALAVNLQGRINDLPDGASKQSFLAAFNPVMSNIQQIQSHGDYDHSPALFANEYQTNMRTLKYIDQELSRRTAETTVVPDTPSQPAQDVKPFTPSGGSVPLPYFQGFIPETITQSNQWGGGASGGSISSAPATWLVLAGIVGVIGYIYLKRRK